MISLPEGIDAPTVCEILRDAGDIMVDAHREKYGIVDGVEDKDSTHAGVNFVTKYDREVQAFLFRELGRACPEASFLGEEDNGQEKVNPYRGWCFVIDPIDGTANFVRDYRCSSISVALLNNGQPAMGAIYLPYWDMTFYAEAGRGARCMSHFEFFAGWRNSVPVLRTPYRPLAEGICALGTSPYYKETLGDATVQLFETFFQHCSDIRRSGSAAFDLCCVATGRTDVFVEARLSPWDYAAGALIVSEAGGRVTRLDGRSLRYDKPCSVLATGAGCYDEALALTRNIKIPLEN